MLQDSLHHVQPVEAPYSFAEEGEEAVSQARPRQWRRTETPADTTRPDPAHMMPLPPGRELQMLPEVLTDDHWSDGLLRVEKSPFARELDSITGQRSTAGAIILRGKAGDPIPYRFRTDNFVNCALLLSFFLAVWVIARSRHFLAAQVKDFFSARQRENLFSARTERELRGQIYLVFQTCFVLGLLFFDYTQERMTEVFNQVSPYLILGSAVGICLVYYLVKAGLYAFVNAVFFTRDACRRWSDTYMLSILFTGLTLLPVTLLVVYFDLSFEGMVWVCLILVALGKICLLYKAFRIFFNYPGGVAHLFLYFCTLEVAPLFILFRALVFADSLLLTLR